MSVTKITSLDQLHGLEDELFSDVFANNINVIFQYAEKDISDTLDGKELEIVLTIRQSLCNKVKSLFPEFSPRQPINRKAKHLAIQDVIFLSNSILRDSAVRDMEKVFVSNNKPPIDAEPDLLLPDLDATDPDSVASQLKVFNDEIKELRRLLAGVKQQSCNCRCADPKPVHGTSTPTGITTESNKADPQHEERSDNNADSSVECSSGSSDEDHNEDHNEGFVLPRNRKETRKRSKTIKSATAPTAAPPRSQTKAMYLGNVNPKCKAVDIKKHLEKNRINITKSDILQLHHGEDYASFRVAVPSSKYEAASKIWSKGVKVRPYSENNRLNNNRKQRKLGTGGNFGNKVGAKPTTPPHTREVSGSVFSAGYQQAMQDARKHFWEHTRSAPVPTSRRSPWYCGQYQPHQSQPSPHLPFRSDEWPPLHCSW